MGIECVITQKKKKKIRRFQIIRKDFFVVEKKKAESLSRFSAFFVTFVSPQNQSNMNKG